MDLLISTGPPHSMHLIALGLKRSVGTKWIADFRDPWTNIDFYKELMLSDRADRKHKRLEQAVLKNADLSLTIGYTMTQEMKALGADRVQTLTNGFDADDFKDRNINANVDTKFSITHIGSFTPSRNHVGFWKALEELKMENQSFAQKLKIRTVGVVDHKVRSSINEFGLNENWEEIPYVPHDQVLNYQRSSRVLLVSINNTPNATGILPGKFFEYLASGRPILAIGPAKSDIGKVLNQTKAGIIVEPEDVQGMKEALLQLFKDEADFKPDQEAIKKFTRRGLTQELVNVMSSIMK
jgi:glycosyltransferase involved in cell wall biosynthesis